MSEMVERVARAIEEERGRWVMRANDDSEEACRYDDSGLAGYFSEIHKIGRGRSAETKFEELRAAACARAAITTMRKPTEAMVDAGAESLYGHPRHKAEEWAKLEKYEGDGHAAVEAYRAMILASLSPKESD